MPDPSIAKIRIREYLRTDAEMQTVMNGEFTKLVNLVSSGAQPFAGEFKAIGLEVHDASGDLRPIVDIFVEFSVWASDTAPEAVAQRESLMDKLQQDADKTKRTQHAKRPTGGGYH